MKTKHDTLFPAGFEEEALVPFLSEVELIAVREKLLCERANGNFSGVDDDSFWGIVFAAL